MKDLGKGAVGRELMISQLASVRRSIAWAVGLAGLMVAGISSLNLAAAEDERYSKILAQADSAYGEYLAGQCVTCHAPTGAPEGIPHIHGLPDVYLVQTMLAYKEGTHGRTNPAMVNIAKNLSEEELGSLAKYFSEQPVD